VCVFKEDIKCAHSLLVMAKNKR